MVASYLRHAPLCGVDSEHKMPGVDMTNIDALAYMASGAVLGLAGGLSPGPLTALVIRQTLQFGTREGLKVALVPVCTDGPLVALGAFTIASLQGLDGVLGTIGLLGALFLFWLAWETSRASPPEVEVGDTSEANSASKALVANFLNPHPYLFWFAVGGPIVAEAWALGIGSVLAFCLGFFFCLCGAKIALAGLTGRYRHVLLGPAYRWIMRGLALAMLLFALQFAHKGAALLGWMR